jgi:hypothetical protein
MLSYVPQQPQQQQQQLQQLQYQPPPPPKAINEAIYPSSYTVPPSSDFLRLPYPHYESQRKTVSSGYSSSSTASTVSPPSTSGGKKGEATASNKADAESRAKLYFCDLCQVTNFAELH